MPSGIVVNAASAALFLYINGHGSAIFRDGLRLVLIMFLACSAAWALVEFLATIIEPTAPTTCQVAVIFSSLFDQLGRFLIEQYLAWATQTKGTKTIWSVILQVLLLGRFGIGMAFVGLSRSDFNPTCVPVSSVLPLAIVTIVVDVVIVGLVLIQVLSLSSTENQATTNHKKCVMLVIVGLVIWFAVSFCQLPCHVCFYTNDP